MAINNRLDSSVVIVELRLCLTSAVAPLIWSSVRLRDITVLIVLYD